MSERAPSPEEWSAAAKAGEQRRSVGVPSGLSTTIPAELLQELIDAARDGLPNEACGLLVGPSHATDGGRPTRFVPLRNAAESPYRYFIASDDLLTIIDIEDAGEVVWAIFHSHVASPPEPSATDVGLALYPDSLYLICSLENSVPEVRAWSIRDGEVSEVELVVG